MVDDINRKATDLRQLQIFNSIDKPPHKFRLEDWAAYHSEIFHKRSAAFRPFSAPVRVAFAMTIHKSQGPDVRCSKGEDENRFFD
ncbi:hypothetical protein VTP01DRAFT_3032 [Rhizomucor pusillus]|uniref:uncharacterized protein n=1 Tax=Rhizomucor pusillus TaxID=4840 RepID=UPI003742D0E8